MMQLTSLIGVNSRSETVTIHFLEFIATEYCIDLRCWGLQPEVGGTEPALELQVDPAPHRSGRLQKLNPSQTG